MPDMKFQSLWYVRRNDGASGPFPESWIRRDLLLGRLAPEDEVSPDRMSWIAIRDQPQWFRAGPEPCPATDLPQWREERRRARLRWLDERLGLALWVDGRECRPASVGDCL